MKRKDKRNYLIFTLFFIINFLMLYTFYQNYNKFLNIQNNEGAMLSEKGIQNENTLYLLWYQIWGGSDNDQGYSIALDNNNNCLLAGFTNSFGAGLNDAFLLKYNSTGDLLWNLTWGGPSNDRGWSVAVDEYNNIYLTGYTNNSLTSSIDAYLVKYNSTGYLLWNVTWGGTSGEGGKSIAVDNINNIYLTGYTQSFGAGLNDAFLLKYNSTGALIWNLTWGKNNDDMGCDIAIDDNNDIYLIGYTWNTSGGYDAFLAKFNYLGKQIWNQTWGGLDDDYGRGITLENGFIYMVGNTYSFGAGFSDAFIVKFNFTGNQCWNKTWGGFDYDVGNKIVVDSSNNSYLSGTTGSFGIGANDIAIVKYDPSGKQLWNGTWGGPDNDNGNGIAIDKANNFYAAGMTENFGTTSYDVLLIKYGSIFDALKLTQFNATKITVQGENCSLYLSFEINPFNSIIVNISLTSPAFESYYFYNIILENVTNTNLIFNMTAKEFAALGDQIISVEIVSFNDILTTNYTYTNILPAYQMFNISAAPYTVQGENCTISVEIYNNRGVEVLVNFTLTGIEFLERTYLNKKLDLGINLFEFKVIAKEFATLSAQSVTLTITRLGMVISADTTKTTILQAYQVMQINASPYTVQGENCTITFGVYNNRSVSVPLNITLIGSEFIELTYYDLNLIVGLNLFELDFVTKIFASVGLQSINLNIFRLGNLVATNITRITILPAYKFENFFIPPKITQNEVHQVSVILINNRSIPIEYRVQLGGLGFISVNLSFIIVPHLWQQVEIPLQFVPYSIYEEGLRNFTIAIYYNYQLLYYSEFSTTVTLSAGNIFLGFILPVIIGAVSVISAYKGYRQITKIRKDRKVQRVKKDLLNRIAERLISSKTYFKSQLQDNFARLEIDLKAFAKSHKFSLSELQEILPIFIEQAGLGGYFLKDLLYLPLNYGFRIFTASAQKSKFDIEVLAHAFSDLEKWSKLILEFIAEHQHSPEREEAWRIGIPFEKIDAVLNYINIQVQPGLLAELSPVEKEYFDQLSIKVIQYINQVKAQPTFSDLVINLGLSVKDAKLIIPYINEVLNQEIQVNNKEISNHQV